MKKHQVTINIHDEMGLRTIFQGSIYSEEDSLDEILESLEVNRDKTEEISSEEFESALNDAE